MVSTAYIPTTFLPSSKVFLILGKLFNSIKSKYSLSWTNYIIFKNLRDKLLSWAWYAKELSSSVSSEVGNMWFFVSSRSVKMRGFSFLSLYKSVFIFQFLNVKMYNYGKQNIIVNFIIKKLKKTQFPQKVKKLSSLAERT